MTNTERKKLLEIRERICAQKEEAERLLQIEKDPSLFRFFLWNLNQIEQYLQEIDELLGNHSGFSAQ